MALKKVVSADDAVALIRDGDVVASSGYGGNGNPEALFVAIERRFLAGNGPHELTLVWAGGQGDGNERGLNRLGHESLLKRTIGGHYGLIRGSRLSPSRTRSLARNREMRLQTDRSRPATGGGGTGNRCPEGRARTAAVFPNR